jgi:hypothetical protein
VGGEGRLERLWNGSAKGAGYETLKVFVLDEGGYHGGRRWAPSQLVVDQKAGRVKESLFRSHFPPEVDRLIYHKMVEKPDKILIEAGPEFFGT